MRAALFLAGALALASLPSGASADGDEKEPELRVEDFDALKPLHTFKLPETDGPVPRIALAPDGGTLAICDKNRIDFWNLRTGKRATPAWALAKGKEAWHLTFVTASAVAVWVSESAIEVYEYPSGKRTAQLDLGKDEGGLTFLGTDGLVLMSNFAETYAWGGPGWKRLWKFTDGKEFCPSQFSLSPDRREIAIGSERTCSHYLVLSAKDGKELRKVNLDERAYGRTCVAHTADGRVLAIGSRHTGKENDIFAELCLYEGGKTRVLARVHEGDEPHRLQMAPDGRSFVVTLTAQGQESVRFSALAIPELRSSCAVVFELSTGSVRRTFSTPLGEEVTLLPRGREVLVHQHAKDVNVYSLRGAAAKDREPLGAARRRELWAAFALPNAAAAFDAMLELEARPADAAKLIAEHVKPVPAVDAATAKRLLAELGSNDFATRERAEAHLSELGAGIEGDVRAAARGHDDPEVRTRAAALVKKLDNAPANLRTARAVEVLEHADGPECRAVLKALAGGAPGARLTRDASASLSRLIARDPKP